MSRFRVDWLPGSGSTFRSIPDLDQIDLVVMMGAQLGIKGHNLHPTAWDRVRSVRQLLMQYGIRDRIRVFADGGIRHNTVPALRAVGADGIVPGSLVFDNADLPATIATLHQRSAPVTRPGTEESR